MTAIVTLPSPASLSHAPSTIEERTKNENLSTIRNMQIAFWSNFLFAIIEIVGAFFTNSVTILSDAVHDIGDSVVIGLSLIFEKKSVKDRTSKYTYGYRRFSILGAFCTSLILILGSLFIVYKAIDRFIHTETVHTTGVIWLAVLGIIFNGFAVIRLKTGSKKSLNQRGIMLHLLEDVLGWVTVLIGAIVMHYTSWFWIDPLLSLIIAAIILWNAVKNIIPTIKIFLQAAPPDYNEVEIVNRITALTSVHSIKEINCWTIDGEEHIFTASIQLNNTPEAGCSEELRLAIGSILSDYSIRKTILQFE